MIPFTDIYHAYRFVYPHCPPEGYDPGPYEIQVDPRCNQRRTVARATETAPSYVAATENYIKISFNGDLFGWMTLLTNVTINQNKLVRCLNISRNNVLKTSIGATNITQTYKCFS